MSISHLDNTGEFADVLDMEKLYFKKQCFFQKEGEAAIFMPDGFIGSLGTLNRILKFGLEKGGHKLTEVRSFAQKTALDELRNLIIRRENPFNPAQLEQMREAAAQIQAMSPEYREISADLLLLAGEFDKIIS